MSVRLRTATLVVMQHHDSPCHDCDVDEPVRPALSQPSSQPSPRPLPTPGHLPTQADLGRGNRVDASASDVVFVRCPECDSIASVEWRSTAAATGGGPVGHAKVRCITGHWFLLPTAWLTAA
jgi:hypothetical protein